MIPDTTAHATLVERRRAQPTFDEIDATAAELSRVLVDLAARARYAKVEGAAMPLLAHARGLCKRLHDQVDRAPPPLRARFETQALQLEDRLAAVAAAFDRLRALA